MINLRIVLVLVCSLLIVGCSSSLHVREQDAKRMGMQLVWPKDKHKENGRTRYLPDMKSMPAPNGFVITPKDISDMCSGRKYLIVIYRDDKYYYAAKLSASPLLAKEYGIKVDGNTGDITHPIKKNNYSIRYTHEYSDVIIERKKYQ